MSSGKLTSLFFLVLLNPCLSQQVTVKFNNDPRVIRDVLLEAHLSGSMVFSGGCKFQDRTAPVPFVGMRRDLGSVSETLGQMLTVNSKMRVTQDKDGMIRMAEADVPTDILDVKIHYISFKVPDVHGSSDYTLHGPWVALWTILRSPEVESFRKAHHIDLARGMDRLPGNVTDASVPDVTGELYDVTLSKALDYVLKTSPGYWVYEDASCEDGTRAVRFKFY